MMRFRKGARRRMRLRYWAFDFVQLPPITMLLQVLDGLARHVPTLFTGQPKP